MNLFLKEHQNILFLLLKHRVEFIIIGGYAVIYHGYERTTSDLDLWLKPDNQNRNKFINALAEHGVVNDHLEMIKTMDFTKPQVLHIGEKPNKIDFLTHIQGLKFVETEKKKELLVLDNRQIPVLHYDHLIITKMVTGRPQDKADIDKLKKIQQYKNRK